MIIICYVPWPIGERKGCDGGSSLNSSSMEHSIFWGGGVVVK